MTLMPSSSSGRPKVKRAWPVCRSTPINPSQMPKNSAANPLTADEPSTADTVTNASTIREK
jgi:hypothetical protein